MGLLASDMNAYVMGFFLSLSIVNVWENTSTFLSRKTKLDALQWASSVGQILNLILHMVLNTAKDLDCGPVVVAETVFFYVMQIGSLYVIIYRGTAIISNPSRRHLIRYGLAVLLATSVGLNIASGVLKEMYVADGICHVIYHRQLNDICKILLAVLYIGLLVAFITPLVTNIRRAGQYVDTSSLKDVATVTGIKITFAIIVQLVTVVLSIVGVLGRYFWIQFTIQNYSMVWASTVASRKVGDGSGTGLVSSHTRRQAQIESSNNKVWRYEMPSKAYDPNLKPHPVHISVNRDVMKHPTDLT